MTETRNQHIVHFDLDSFFVSVEIKNNPLLKGKPVLVGGYERGVVAACSYEARKYGIHSAMPMKKAMQLCPHAIITNSSRSEYVKYSRWVTDIIAARVPAFEKASIDEFYIDLTGMDKFYGVAKYALHLRQEIIRETGLPISGGLSTAKYISKIATNEAKPNGFLQITPGKELEFLWPLAIEKINGVGKQTESVLKAAGLFTMEDVAKCSVGTLDRLLGKWGVALWEKANGISNETIVSSWEQKSISHENTFEKDLSDPAQLNKELVRLTEKAAYSLREEDKLAGCLTIKIRYSDFETTSKQESMDYTALDDQLISKARDLFTQHYRRGRPVRLLGVRLSQLVPMNLQMSLFDKNFEKLNLYKAVDTIKDKYGKNLIKKATNT